MNCPNCNETLLMTERQSVEIDYCPKCRGIWLDKGELDKLLDHAQKSENRDYVNDQNKSHSQSYERNDNYSDRNKYPHGRKKKSFLSDFFDFD